ncbi:SsgA family sporulation/cell division regulator [Streptomyces sp. NPDC052610]|uniref:SsgA family sporulation/cell division regulator n=1 Tax=Streptomyces sp. NPDC052610 TaxID=3154952 RepID=UPI00344344E4
MNSFVHRTLVMQLQAGTSDRFPVLAHLRYDAEDPFAVTMVFSHDGRVLARWRLDREMLAEGLCRPVGVGDVRMRPASTDRWEELRLDFFGDPRADGGHHHATVFAWAPAVAAFLRDSHAVVAPGRERIRVDDFLAEVIAEG